jgi:hypothetical protein
VVRCSASLVVIQDEISSGGYNLSLDSQSSQPLASDSSHNTDQPTFKNQSQHSPVQPSRSDLLCGSARETATSAELATMV